MKVYEGVAPQRHHTFALPAATSSYALSIVTIQLMPNLSVSQPIAAPQGCAVSGILILPPSPRALKMLVTRSLSVPPGAARSHYQRAPATCLMGALRRLKRLVTPIMRSSAASPCSS